MIVPYSTNELEAMLADAESDLVERKASLGGDQHFDAQPMRGTGLDDLRLGRFEDEYLPAALPAEALAVNNRTLEQHLAAAKMILSAPEPVPTVAGILALGKQPLDHLPGAYVRFLRVAGSEWGGEVLDEVRCEGAVSDQIQRLDDKLIAHNRTAVDFTSGRLETRRSAYPLAALQQLTRNAVMHRTYDSAFPPPAASCAQTDTRPRSSMCRPTRCAARCTP